MAQQSKNSFGKGEKLKSRKQIEQLFASGKSFFVHPLKVYWKIEPANPINTAPEVEPDVAVKAGVSASKRNFKKAVDRNRVKRLLRETYRLNKEVLARTCTERQFTLNAFFIYVDKSMPTFNFLGDKMKICILKLEKLVKQS